MNRNEYLGILKDALFKSAKKSLVEAVLKRLPFLALPVINPIFTLIIEKLLKIILNETELRISYLLTDLRINAQAREFIEMANGYKNGTVEEKQLIDSFRSFAKFVQ